MYLNEVCGLSQCINIIREAAKCLCALFSSHAQVVFYLFSKTKRQIKITYRHTPAYINPYIRPLQIRIVLPLASAAALKVACKVHSINGDRLLNLLPLTLASTSMWASKEVELQNKSHIVWDFTFFFLQSMDLTDLICYSCRERHWQLLTIKSYYYSAKHIVQSRPPAS